MQWTERDVLRFWPKVNKTETCWNWTAMTLPEGYGKFSLNGVPVLAHRLSYELHYGPIPEGLLVCHTCDNPSCVRPDHLFLGTNSDNAIDREAKGRGGTRRVDRSGMRSGNRKLSDVQVVEILQRIAANEKQADLAREFNVRPQTISAIKRGLLWTKLPLRNT